MKLNISIKSTLPTDERFMKVFFFFFYKKTTQLKITPNVTPVFSTATAHGGDADGGKWLPRQPHAGHNGGSTGDAGEEIEQGV